MSKYRESAARQEVSTVVRNPNHWEINATTIRRQVQEYMARWLKSSMHNEAVAGRYDLGLMRYVRSVAEYQAQLIVGQQNVGYEGIVIFGSRRGKTDYAMARKEWLDEQRRIAAGGSIDVQIPAWRLDEIKSMADFARDRDFSAPASMQKRQIKPAELGASQITLDVYEQGIGFEEFEALHAQTNTTHFEQI